MHIDTETAIVGGGPAGLSAALDDVGPGTDPVPFKLALTITDDKIICDWTGTGEQRPHAPEKGADDEHHVQTGNRQQMTGTGQAQCLPVIRL